MNRIDYNHVAILTVCVHVRNFSEAARLLHRRPCTISIMMRKLTKAVGEPLFTPSAKRPNRSPRMIPTARAKELARLMEPLLKHTLKLEAELENEDEKTTV